MTAPPLVDQLFSAVLGSLDLAAVALGDRLGWYADLDGAGPSTAAELAERTGTDPRYAREWLEQQAVSGYLEVDDVAAPAADRRYGIRASDRGVLVDPLDENHLAPFARLTLAVTRALPQLAEVYRGNGTLSWADLGADAREGQAGANRPWLLGPMAGQLALVPGVDAALAAGGRVADIGCGFGWASIGIARAWPAARVDAFDVDPPSLAAARQNVVDAGLADRIRVLGHDVTALAGDGSASAGGGYALALAVECVHDLPDPVAVLAAMRAMVAPGGTVVVVDEAVAPRFTAPGDDLERLMYGFSLLCCLPDGRSTEPSVGTGTVMRPDTLRGYARDAGFTDIEVLPIEHDAFRFYRLV